MLSIFPIIDVASWQVFAVKIIAVLAATNLTGIAIYLAGKRREHQPPEAQPAVR